MNAIDLFVHPLTAVRAAHGWTLNDVATIVQRRTGLNMACRREKVWRWEHGVATPELVAQHALADELGIDRSHIATHAWPRWLLLTDPGEPFDAPWTAPAAQDVLGRVVESAAMDRRGFMILSGDALAGLALTWNNTSQTPVVDAAASRVTTDTIDHLNARVEQLWHLDDILGGGHCLDAGIADLRLVTDLIRHGHYSTADEVRLYGLAAALARFCGWAAFESGQQAAAQRLWHAGLRMAAAAGDPGEGVYILSNLALQAVYADDGHSAIALLDVARRQVDPAARTVLAMLDCWATRGHALIGNKKTAAALLNQADDLWEGRHPEDDPEWVYWMPQPSTTAEAGTTLLDIGDLPAAERCLTEGINTLDDDSARDRILYQIRLAEVQNRSGRLDEAIATAHAAVNACADVNSTRVRGQVAKMIGTLPTREPRVMELRDHFRSASSEAATK